MDFLTWEAKNLARTTLSETFRRVIYHMNDRKESSPETNEEDDGFLGWSQIRTSERILKRERVSRTEKIIPRYRTESQIIVPHYRRFARSFSLSGSSSASQDEYPSRPVYRRFSRSEPEIYDSPVIWPVSGRMNAFLGKSKIEEFIKKNWKFGAKIKYTIDFKCIIRLKSGVDRYKYSSLWTNGYFSSRIHFTIDSSSEDDYIPVTMTYSLPDQRIHRPNSSSLHVQNFLKNLDPRHFSS